MHHREVGIAVTVFTVVDITVDSQVASIIAEATMQLQLCAEILVLPIAHRLVLPTIDNQSQIVHRAQSLIAQGICHVFKRISVERGSGRIASAVVGGIREIGTEGERGDRVDGPLQVHVSRPTIVA